MRSGSRSNDFVVGLTNNESVYRAPVPWHYTLCGRYLGPVSDAATVAVHCTNVNNRRLRFRYVIVHFPLVRESMNFCEIEVFTVGKIA